MRSKATRIVAACLRLRQNTALIVACISVCLSALLAHFAIDAVGDFALPHDTYDDIPHDSRGIIFVISLLGTTFAASQLLFALVGETFGNRGKLCRSLSSVLPNSLPIFVSLCTLATLFTLVAMETLDNVLARGRFEDLDDALGGSYLLGVGLTVLCAVGISTILCVAIRWLSGARVDLFLKLHAMYVRKRRSRRTPYYNRHNRRRPVTRRVSILGHRAGKRGPPAARRPSLQGFFA